MSSKTQNSTQIGIALIAIILLTRSSHFGTISLLPDATLAVLFLTGILMKKVRWLIIAITIAFAVDFYALGYAGVSDYCMSLGYWGLIPTYAMVWGVGRYLASLNHPFALSIYVPAAWLSSSLAFILSNAFWYAFSDRFAKLSAMEFSERVAAFYVPYLGYTAFYLAIAWIAQAAFQKLSHRQVKIA